MGAKSSVYKELENAFYEEGAYPASVESSFNNEG